MPASIETFKALRIYRNLSLGLVLNQILCNRLMKISPLVNNASRVYKLSSTIFGKRFVNLIINATFCKTLTAGNTIEEADQMSNYFRKSGTLQSMIRHPSNSRLLCRGRSS